LNPPFAFFTFAFPHLVGQNEHQNCYGYLGSEIFKGKIDAPLSGSPLCSYPRARNFVHAFGSCPGGAGSKDIAQDGHSKLTSSQADARD
jgi:hypothetical protein